VERLRNMTKQALPGSVQTKLRQLEIASAEEKHPVMDRVPERNVELLRNHLRKFVADLRAAGVEPILITHATTFGETVSNPNRDLLIAWRTFYPVIREDGLLDMEKRGNDVIRQVAEEEHVVLVDAARRIAPGPQYFADASHFSTAGASLMARLIADALQPLILSGPGSSVPPNAQASEVR
jgi:lysophospholipase L1-like esterase